MKNIHATLCRGIVYLITSLFIEAACDYSDDLTVACIIPCFKLCVTLPLQSHLHTEGQS